MSANILRQINNSPLMCTIKGNVTITTQPGTQQKIDVTSNVLKRDDSAFYLVLDPLKIFNFYINDTKCNHLRELTQAIYAEHMGDINIKIEIIDGILPKKYDISSDDAKILLEYILNVHASVVRNIFQNIKCPPLVPVTKRQNLPIERTEPYQYINMIHISDYNMSYDSDNRLPLSDEITRLSGISAQNLTNPTETFSAVYGCDKNIINNIHETQYGVEKKCNKVIKFDEKGNIVPAHIAYNNIVSGELRNCFSREKDCYSNTSRNFIYNLLFEAFSILVKQVNEIPIMKFTVNTTQFGKLYIIPLKNLNLNMKNITSYIEDINNDNIDEKYKKLSLYSIVNRIKNITESEIYDDTTKINAIKELVAGQNSALRNKYLKYKAKYKLLKHS